MMAGHAFCSSGGCSAKRPSWSLDTIQIETGHTLDQTARPPSRERLHPAPDAEHRRFEVREGVPLHMAPLAGGWAGEDETTFGVAALSPLTGVS